MSDDVRERISALRAEVLLLDERLRAAVAHQSKTSSNGGGGGGGGKISHSPPPWNAAAGLCRMDLHALAREIERTWRSEGRLRVKARGGSDANTRGALEALDALLLVVPGWLVADSMRQLAKWGLRAGVILGDLEQPRRLPGDVACPYCSMKTLRMWAGAGIVRCVNPSCTMEDGGKAVATPEWIDGEGIRLTWQDGRVL